MMAGFIKRRAAYKFSTSNIDVEMKLNMIWLHTHAVVWKMCRLSNYYNGWNPEIC